MAAKEIRLPRIGWARLKEKGYLPCSDVRNLSCRITERAGRWFVSLFVEEEISDMTPRGEIVGIDLGINRLATCSNGAVIENSKQLKRSLKKLQRAQRELSRKQKGSKNRAKARAKVAQIHLDIRNQRLDAIHKGTSAVVAKAKPAHQRPQAIVLEDLHVKGMVKNHRLAQALHDASLGEIRRQFEYKAAWSGIEIRVAGRWYPSTKLCHRCKRKKADMALSERIYRCEHCHLMMDRDLNAALNLARVDPLKQATYR